MIHTEASIFSCAGGNALLFCYGPNPSREATRSYRGGAVDIIQTTQLRRGDRGFTMKILDREPRLHGIGDGFKKAPRSDHGSTGDITRQIISGPAFELRRM